MRFGFLVIISLLFCSCKKEETVPYISLQNTSWDWISTTQDSTFYEDTATSLNSQFITFIDYKNMDWKRNDSVFYNGLFICKTKVSVLTGTHEMVMDLSGVSKSYVVDRLADTLWLRENVASGSRTYRYLKTN